MTETTTLKLWKRAQGLPLGTWLFSLGVRLRAPYFRTAQPTVEEMGAGRAVVSGPTWWGTRNHIGTMHVIAACNLAETAMGMVCEATVPTTHRWIPKGMTCEYPAKSASSGRVRAVAQLREVPDFATVTSGRDLEVPITITDARGTVFVRAVITVWIAPA